MKHKIFRMLTSLILGVTLAMTQMSPTHAASFVVNDTSDAVDVNPGDGTCATSVGTCTLRAAVMESNALSGDDVITLPAGNYTLYISGVGEDGAAAGDLDVTDNLMITGIGAGTTIIDANNIDRVIEVLSGATLNASGITVTGGRALGSGPSGLGGGIRIFDGTVTIDNSTISSNTALAGGGIQLSWPGGGSLTINNSTISQNTAIISNGGGIYNSSGTTKITGSAIVDNIANNASGGGIFSDFSLEIVESTISGNRASTGGGISNINGALVTITDSTIFDNSATSNGGGIHNSFDGRISINNSTIIGNSSNAKGGGIFNSEVPNNNGGAITLNNGTITDNSAGEGGGIFSSDDPYPNGSGGSMLLRNTITAGNSATIDLDCSGDIGALGYNLIGNSSGCVVATALGNILDVDPILGPLADNGGTTQTVALLAGSPAINAGDNATCETTDQRGVVRPQGAACDIGAFEYELVMIDVSIDIKPGSDTNPINPNSKGKIPVGIMSTDDFDAPSMVNVSSLTFGRFGNEESLAFCNENGEDVNGDGLLDLVCHFYTQATGFQIGDLEGILKGETVEGTPMEGRDVVTILE